MPSNQPIVLLRDAETDRFLPIWIGAVEATAIAFAQQGVQPERPLTHDLLRDVLTSLGRRLDRVDIVDLRDGIFFAELVFDNGVTVSARPSDAIALALRTGSPLFAADHVLDEAAIEMPARMRTRSRATKRERRPKWRPSGSSWTMSPRRISKAAARND